LGRHFLAGGQGSRYKVARSGLQLADSVGNLEILWPRITNLWASGGGEAGRLSEPLMPCGHQ
jgi:hypothetical protein